jgi:hypothetical protein
MRDRKNIRARALGATKSRVGRQPGVELVGAGWLAILSVATCLGCATARGELSRSPSTAIEPDFAVHVVVSESAKRRLLESRSSPLAVEAWAHGMAKVGTPAGWVSEGRIDVWLKTMKLPREGVVYFRNIKPRHERVAALVEPDYAVNIIVRCLKASPDIGLRCDGIDEYISRLQGRTHVITCKLDSE